MTINQSLTIVAPDGSVRGYTTDSNSGKLTEVASGFSNGYSTWQFIEDDWESAPKMLDVNSIYGMPGDSINFDVDHINPEIDSQISSYRLEGHWEDGLNWLNISPSGQLYGEIPQGFEMGGASIVATHPFGRCLPVVQYLSAFYRKK